MGLLKETLAHSSHGLFVLTDFLGDAHKHAKLRRQVDVLAFLFYFKKGLVETHDLLVVLLTEVVHHRNGGSGLSLFEAAGFRAHVPADGADFVSLVVTIASHNDCVLEFIVDGLLNFVLLGGLSGVALALLRKADHLLVDELEAVVDGKVLADVVDNQINASLKDPR